MKWLWRGFVIGGALASIALAILWARSYFQWDELYILWTSSSRSRLHTTRICCFAGDVGGFDHWITSSAQEAKGAKFLTGVWHVPSAKSIKDVRQFWKSDPRHRHYLLDFQWNYRVTPDGVDGLEGMARFGVSLWMIMVAFAIFPGMHWLTSAVRRKRKGLCAKCGYDLRASPERCPECGTAVPPQRSSPKLQT
jgi:hypothetical protein